MMAEPTELQFQTELMSLADQPRQETLTALSRVACDVATAYAGRLMEGERTDWPSLTSIKIERIVAPKGNYGDKQAKFTRYIVFKIASLARTELLPRYELWYRDDYLELGDTFRELRAPLDTSEVDVTITDADASRLYDLLMNASI